MLSLWQYLVLGTLASALGEHATLTTACGAELLTGDIVDRFRLDFDGWTARLWSSLTLAVSVSNRSDHRLEGGSPRFSVSIVPLQPAWRYATNTTDDADGRTTLLHVTRSADSNASFTVEVEYLRESHGCFAVSGRALMTRVVLVATDVTTVRTDHERVSGMCPHVQEADCVDLPVPVTPLPFGFIPLGLLIGVAAVVRYRK